MTLCFTFLLNYPCPFSFFAGKPDHQERSHTVTRIIPRRLTAKGRMDDAVSPTSRVVSACKKVNTDFFAGRHLLSTRGRPLVRFRPITFCAWPSPRRSCLKYSCFLHKTRSKFFFPERHPNVAKKTSPPPLLLSCNYGPGATRAVVSHCKV